MTQFNTVIDQQKQDAEMLSKEKCYDLIGDLNIKIVKLDENILTLQDMILVMNDFSPMPNESHIIAESQQQLHEFRMMRDTALSQIKQLRLRLISTLELEFEKNEMIIRDAHPNWNEGEQVRYELSREIDNLKFLVSDERKV